MIDQKTFDGTMMNAREAIKAVREGRRANTKTSLHSEEAPMPFCDHRWREVACDSENDVLECSRCGKQKLEGCTFDFDYA